MHGARSLLTTIWASIWRLWAKTQEARTIYKKGLVVNKGPLFDYFLDYNYGRFLLKERKLQESKVHLDRAVSLAPETRAVYYEPAG
jgi:hypothetical protein